MCEDLPAGRCDCINIQIIYMTNLLDGCTVYLRDRPAGKKKPAYLAGFLAFFFAAFSCGFGGVLSILRSTSSGFGSGGSGRSCFMAGV